MIVDASVNWEQLDNGICLIVFGLLEHSFVCQSLTVRYVIMEVLGERGLISLILECAELGLEEADLVGIVN